MHNDTLAFVMCSVMCKRISSLRSVHKHFNRVFTIILFYFLNPDTHLEDVERLKLNPLAVWMAIAERRLLQLDTRG